jgi:hypothetical protein
MTWYRDGEECVWSEHLGQTGDDPFIRHIHDSDESLLDELWMLHLVPADEDDLSLECYLEGDDD